MLSLFPANLSVALPPATELGVIHTYHCISFPSLLFSFDIWTPATRGGHFTAKRIRYRLYCALRREETRGACFGGIKG